MKHIFLLLVICLPNVLNAQTTQLHYRDCDGCPVGANSNPPVSQALYPYGQNTAYTTGDIESDFDLRRADGNSRWHKGIDLRNHGAGDDEINQRGDAIINPDSNAIITQFDHTGYKWLVLDGAYYDFGYGHIFSHNNINNSNTWRNGNFVLKMSEPDSSGNRFPCIIDLNSCTVYSTENGIKTILPTNPHCNDTLTTTNQVAQGAAIAPIGGSRESLTLEFPVHIHLYKLRDPSVTWSNSNCMDPLVDLQHPDTDFELNMAFNKNIEAPGFDEWNNITDFTYPGTQSNCVAIRATMENAMQGIDASRYTNVAHNLDSVRILIQKPGSQNFEPIVGPYYRSEFLLHAKRFTPLYPDNIHNHYGNVTTTGISPRAYQDGTLFRPYDNYYFADFITRIDDVDLMDGNESPTLIADDPRWARYNDGLYHIYAEVTDVREGEHASNVYGFRIDNFMPYIDAVEVYIGAELIYQRDWNFTDPNRTNPNDGVINLLPGSTEKAIGTSGIEIFAYSSEPLEFLSATIPDLSPNTFQGVFTDENQMVWRFNLGPLVSAMEDSCYTIQFSGEDINANPLLDLRAMANGQDMAGANIHIPKRQNSDDDANTWLPAANYTGTDDVHEFCVELTCTNDLTGGNGQSRSSTDCLDASDIEITLKSEESPGQSDGAIYVDISGGTAPFLFTWKDEAGNIISTSTTNPNLIDVPAGLYCFEFEDEMCCKVYGCRTVRECTEIIDYIEQSGTCGEDNGSLVVIVDGENTTPPYSYVWDNGGTTQILTGLSVGEYCVTVTDGGGCTDTECVSLNETFTIEAEITDACEIEGGAIALTIAGNPGASYYFEWNNDEYTQDIDSLQPGTYCVTVTNEDDCSVEECFDVEDNFDPEFAIELESIECICPEGYGGIDITVTGNSGPYTYIWTGPNGEFSDEEDFNNITSSGNYSIDVINTLGCTVNESITIDYCDFDFTNFTTDINHSCDGPNTGSIEVQVSPPNAASAPFQYILEDVNNNFILSDESLDGDILIDGLGAGEYCLTVLSANGCETTSNCGLIIELMFPPNIDWIVTPATDLTSGDGAIDLTVDGDFGPYTYSWMPGGATTEDINGLNPGSYTVDIVDDQGDCTYSATIQVEECVDLEINITMIAEVTPMTGDFDDGAIDITLENGDGYQFTFLWSNGATTEDIGPLSEGEYCVTVTQNECNGFQLTDCFDICSFGLDLGFESYENCIGTTINTYISGGVGPFTYQWSPIGSSSPNPFLPYGENCVEITDGNGCQTSKCITIEIPELELTLDVTNATMGITNGSVSTTVQGGFPPYTYLWDNGSTNPDILYLMPGKYCVTVTDFCGNTVSECARVNCEIDSRHVTAEITDVSCNSGALGAIELEVLFFDPNNPNNTFTWSNGATTEDISGLVAGEYCVTIVDGWSSCEYSDCFTVDAIGTGDFSVLVEYDLPCFGNDGGSITAIPSEGEPEDYTYFWQYWGVPPFTSSEQTLSNIRAGWYGVTVTDELGCSVSDFTLVWPSASLFAVATNATQGECDGSIIMTINSTAPPFVVTLEGMGTSTTITTYNTNPIFSNLCPGEYTITCVDDNQCEAQIVRTINSCGTITFGNPQITNPTNCTSNIGSIDYSGNVPTGGVAPYTFSWSTGETGESVENLPIGQYTVTITDADGCTLEATHSIQIGNNDPQYAQFTLEVIETQPDLSSCQGSITVHVFYAFNPGYTVGLKLEGYGTLIDIDLGYGGVDEIYTFNDLCAGEYNITAKYSGFGIFPCSIYASAIVESCPDFVLDGLPQIILPSGCNAVNGSITYGLPNPSGGTSPVMWLWSNGETTPNSINDLSSGIYGLTILDNIGCSIIKEYDLTIPSDAANVFIESIEHETSGCDAVVEISGFNDVNLHLTGDNGTNINIDMTGDAYTFNDLCAGNYTLFITDINNCQNEINFEIYSCSPITISDPKIIDPTDCSSNDGIIDFKFGGPSGGTLPYTRVLLDEYGNEMDNLPGFFIFPDLAEGDYTLIITDALGCKAEFTYTLTSNATPQILVEWIKDECEDEFNGIVLLAVQSPNGNQNFNFEWSTGQIDNNTYIAEILHLETGNYSVTVTDAGGTCSGSFDFFVDEIPSTGEYTANITENISSCPYEPTGSFIIDIQGGNPSYHLVITSETNPIFWKHFYLNEAGEFEVTDLPSDNYIVTITDVCDRDIQINLFIDEYPPMDIVLEEVKGCEGELGIDLIITGAGVPDTFSWSNGANTQDLEGLSSGPYSVTVADIYGCTEEADIILDDPEPLNVSFDQKHIVFYKPSALSQTFTILDGKIDAEIIGGVPDDNFGFKYKWKYPDNSETDEENTFNTNLPPLDNLEMPGTYTLYVTDHCTPYSFEYSLEYCNINCSHIHASNFCNINAGLCGDRFVDNFYTGLASPEYPVCQGPNEDKWVNINEGNCTFDVLCRSGADPDIANSYPGEQVSFYSGHHDESSDETVCFQYFYCVANVDYDDNIIDPVYGYHVIGEAFKFKNKIPVTPNINGTGSGNLTCSDPLQELKAVWCGNVLLYEACVPICENPTETPNLQDCSITFTCPDNTSTTIDQPLGQCYLKVQGEAFEYNLVELCLMDLNANTEATIVSEGHIIYEDFEFDQTCCVKYEYPEPCLAFSPDDDAESRADIDNQENEEVKNELNVTIFPNPFSGELNISFDIPEESRVKMNIFNLVGDKIRSYDFDVSENSPIKTIRDFNNLPSGIYLLEILIESNTQKIVKRVIKI